MHNTGQWRGVVDALSRFLRYKLYAMWCDTRRCYAMRYDAMHINDLVLLYACCLLSRFVDLFPVLLTSFLARRTREEFAGGTHQRTLPSPTLFSSTNFICWLAAFFFPDFSLNGQASSLVHSSLDFISTSTSIPSSSPKSIHPHVS
jgi:hypothetical protein